MRGDEFIRKVKKYAKKQGFAFEWRPERGKGSHGLLILAGCRTVVRNPRDELKTGTYHAMLKQLGLTERDI